MKVPKGRSLITAIFFDMLFKHLTQFEAKVQYLPFFGNDGKQNKRLPLKIVDTND